VGSRIAVAEVVVTPAADGHDAAEPVAHATVSYFMPGPS
jgi:acyl-coenzyme A thioesterase PaaI-like protein